MRVLNQFLSRKGRKYAKIPEEKAKRSIMGL
jgi:hypothetical protein